MPRVMADRRQLSKLAVVGTAGGLFSGLFGVGGGTVVVPLLVLWLGYDERTATATSLAAIAVVAVAAVAVHGAFGNVHVAEGVLIGLPAVAGTLLGTWLQQRVPSKAVSLTFAAVLAVVATLLIAR